MSRPVVVTGGTGYMGRRLVTALLDRGHHVRVLTRAASVTRVPRGADTVIGDALDAQTTAAVLTADDTVVHLVGTPHPNPRKAQSFIDVDLASVRAIASAAQRVGIRHLVYVSVAQPAPAMRAYLAARQAGEQAIREAGLTATVLRPWYVLGPGHWWPLMLMPLYAVAERVPAWREGATRLGLVTLEQMVQALVTAVEATPAAGTFSIVDVAAIRKSSRSSNHFGGLARSRSA